MANKKEFIAHYLKYGQNQPWSVLAKIFHFQSGEALRSFTRRNRRNFSEYKLPVEGLLGKDTVSVFPDVNTVRVPTKYKVCIDSQFKPVLTEKENNRETGEEVLTFTSASPLTPSEIDELAGVDNITRVVSRTWLKSNKMGQWTYSVCTKLIEKDKLPTTDYRKEFEEFLKDKVKDENVDKFLLGKDLLDTDNALILSLSDLHLDKKSYIEETGEVGNTELSMHRALHAAIDIIDRAEAAHDITRIYIIGGNDFFHANSAANTTKKGTPLDVDGRWNTSFKKGLSLITDIIEYAKTIAPVEYITVLGNHSPEREFYLSVSLEAFYRNDEDVTVETVNNVRKYFRFGNSAFMLSHEFGNKEKDLPVIFAIENAKDFAESKYKYVLSGHIHSRKETMYTGTSEQYGIVHKVMPSLSSTDAWHYENLFIANQKSCIGLVVNSKYGQIAELIYNV